jgi:hypothetical protein
MPNQNLFKTYFYIGVDETSIFVKNNENSEIVYSKNQKIIKKFNYLNNNDIQSFFNDNIEEIEKKIKIFVENIVLILEHKEIFSIRLSLKQKVDNKNISNEEIQKLLSSGLQQIYKNHPNQIILHYLIERVDIDGQLYESLENKFIKNYLCIDLRFICIHQNVINIFKDLFKKKQIFLGKVISAKYINDFLTGKDNLISLISKIEGGLNKLEVQLIPKKQEKKGFFERFFLSF